MNLYVTPRAGVWIEIIVGEVMSASSLSLPVRECGLKSINRSTKVAPQSHSPGGSVD